MSAHPILMRQRSEQRETDEVTVEKKSKKDKKKKKAKAVEDAMVVDPPGAFGACIYAVGLSG